MISINQERLVNLDTFQEGIGFSHRNHERYGYSHLKLKIGRGILDDTTGKTLHPPSSSGRVHR
jgi:hypothetical protein